MNRSKLTRQLYLLLLLLMSCYLNSAANNYQNRPVTIEDGLSQNFVDYIYKDSRGFMWFATWSGLDRYDGNNFVHYTNHGEINVLNSNIVRTICEDNYKRLWIGTEQGINRLNLKTEKLTTLRINNSDSTLLKSSTNIIYNDHSGNIWIGTLLGIQRISFSKDGTISNSESLKNDNTSLNTTAIFEDKTHRLWLGMGSGEIRVLNNSNADGFHFENIPFDASPLRNKRITSFAEDSIGNLWIATDGGLFTYQPNKNTLLSYYQGIEPINIPHNHVNAIAIDSKQQLWIGTLGGIGCYNIKNGDFTTIKSNGLINGLNNNFINSLCVDESDIVWIGTEKGGINKLYKTNKQFKNYSNNPFDISTISPNPVNAICRSKNGDLWTGTIEGGLNRMKANESSFSHYNFERENASSLSHNSVSVIYEDRDDHLWIGTWGGSLNQYQPKTNNFKRYESPTLSNLISCIAEDKKSPYLWIGTATGLNLVNRVTGKDLLIFPATHQNYIHEVGTIICDSLNRMWVGTNYGLYCIISDSSNFETNEITYRYWSSLNKKSNTTAPIRLLSTTITHDGSIWFGTHGQGVYKLDSNDYYNYNFELLSHQNELNNNIVYSIREDNNGQLWFGTNRGLTRYSISDSTSKSYTKSDGLIDNQFYWNASFKDQNGILYFGTTEGLIYFNPKEIKDNINKPIVRLSKFKLLNQEVLPGDKYGNQTPLTESITTAKQINIREVDNSFSFEFTALHYQAPEKLKYAYKLENFDNQWTEVASDRRFANYTNIKQGTYNFLVKCTNNDGIWSDSITRISIKVIPPFYKTFLFMLLITILLIVVTVTIIYGRIRAIRRENLVLEEKVSERTKQIEEQKHILENQAKDLEKSLDDLLTNKKMISDKNEILTHQNEEILRQKTELLELNQKVQEINQEKIRFFINISHEFRTPITLILGPIEQLLKSTKDNATLKKLELMNRNARRLLSLINQLMDFRKVETGNMQLHASLGDISEITKEITTSFSPLADNKHIKLLFQSHPEKIIAMIDNNKYQMAITNILSNAIKFTPNKGTVSVQITQFEKEGKGNWIKMLISDTGAGIPENDLKTIFERFYQSHSKDMPDTNSSGTGIGLYLAKKLIELHEGEIEAINQPKGGACFIIYMPLNIGEELTEIPTEKMLQLNLPQQKEEEIEEDTSTKRNKPLLLLVEDDNDMRAYISSIFEDDYSIIEAANGKEGLSITQKMIPDFIISDVMMPIMDGITFCKQVKNNINTSHIPVLLLTARTSTDKQIESFDSGANAFVTKPFDEQLLLSRVNNLIESRKQLQDKFRFDHNPTTLELQSNSPNMKFMQKALDVLKSQYTNPSFDVANFVSEMGMSRSLLHKKLQSLTGESASKFIRAYRLNMAKALMQNERDKNISEIAYKVGFNDPKYFTRCFSKQFGVSPRIFIEKNITDLEIDQ